MNKHAVLFFILNIIFPAKQSSDTEFDSNVTQSLHVTVSGFRFLQTLDHFNLIDDGQRWYQNYWVISNYYRKNGPAFLFVNGEHHVDKTWGYGFQYAALSYAKKLNAICFSLEHRFYGETQPTNGNFLKHLSIAQVLADISSFIKGVTKDFHLPKDTNWVAIGCSYAGALAAWSRLKYPEVVHAAVASSAPILAKADYYEFEQIIEESLRSHSSKCIESIQLGFEEIAYLANSPQNIENILEMFYFEKEHFDDIAIVKTYLLHILMDIFKRAVQGNDTTQMPIPLVCRIMVEHTGTKLEALAQIRKLDMKYREDLENVPSEKRSQEGQNSVKDNCSKRCSELGHYSSYNATHLSSVKHLLMTLEMDIKRDCEPFFGPNVEHLNERISHTNSQYGGLGINVSNTIFINGSLDPWHLISPFKKLNDSLYETIFIKGTSHCADIYPPTERDIPELKNARDKILQILTIWLKKRPNN